MSEIKKLLAEFAESLGQKVSQALREQEEKFSERIEELRESVRSQEKAYSESESAHISKIEGMIKEVEQRVSDSTQSADGSLDEAKAYADELLLGLKAAQNDLPSAEEVASLAAKSLEPEIIKLIEKESEALKDLFKRFEETIKVPEIPQVENGKDALQIEILPSIDESKSYPRGTYASHDGGLFRAFQKTSGMHGWECVINGVKSVDTVIDGKSATLVVTLSDGTSKSASSTIPIPEYKGIYRRGEVYAAKDMTTWGGSVWIATKDVDAAEEPGKCDAWQLMVKRGGDGRGLYAIAKDNGFKGTEKDLYEQITSGKQHQNIVRLRNGDN